MDKKNSKKIGKIQCSWHGDLKAAGDEIKINFSLGTWCGTGRIIMRRGDDHSVDYVPQADFLNGRWQPFAKMHHALAFLAVNFLTAHKMRGLMPSPGRTIN